MNEVSIIIDGVRYDATDAKNSEYACKECHILHLCERRPYTCICLAFELDETKCFKKSTKSFEK